MSLPGAGVADTEATPGAEMRGRGDGPGDVPTLGPKPPPVGAGVRGICPVRRGAPKDSGAWHKAQACDCIGLNASH
jgi:hypothetical protein